MKYHDLAEPAVPAEPTNAQIDEGTWQQPKRTAQVEVPEGAFAQLEQARAMYEELTPEAFKAYNRLSGLVSPDKEFAEKGDMSPEAAEALAAARASGVFNRIRVYVPRTKLEHTMDAAIVGKIDTIGGKVRYFRINPPPPGAWQTDEVVAWWKAHWWADGSHIFGVVIATLIVLGVGVPIALATAYKNGEYLFLWLPAAIFVFLALGMFFSAMSED